MFRSVPRESDPVDIAGLIPSPDAANAFTCALSWMCYLYYNAALFNKPTPGYYVEL